MILPSLLAVMKCYIYSELEEVKIYFKFIEVYIQSQNMAHCAINKRCGMNCISYLNYDTEKNNSQPHNLISFRM